jgi:hypothetical protein
VHPKRPDFSGDQVTANTQPLALTAAYLREVMYTNTTDETQMNARALLHNMHEAGFLNKDIYYGELQHDGATEVNQEDYDDQEEDYQNQEENYQNQEDQEENYEDMPALVYFAPTA